MSVGAFLIESIFWLFGIVISVDFLRYIFTGKRLMNWYLTRCLEAIVVVVFPLLFLFLFDSFQLDCCGDSAFFSPKHRPTMYLWIGLCIAAFLYASFNKKIGPPLVEVIVNCLLLIGIALNGVLAKHGSIPFFNALIIVLFITTLVQNQRKLLDVIAENERFDASNLLTRAAWWVLNLSPWAKFPLLLLLCLPIIVLLTAALLLFGQKPDSAIRAFTETYRQGFSQWDYKCDDVACNDGHYLCSIAAKGHKTVVKPLRLGIRNSRHIVCNRQLLVANAFEELLQERFPKLHKIVRRNYNKVGRSVHRYYFLFDFPLVSDFVYVVMKPLEWVFRMALYLCDEKPENRIARQYMPNPHPRV